jgi:hypothetical protein
MSEKEELKKRIDTGFKVIFDKNLNRLYFSAGTLIRFRDTCIEYGKLLAEEKAREKMKRFLLLLEDRQVKKLREELSQEMRLK